MKISRRGFIGGLGAVFLCAPAVVRAGNLMPVSNAKLIKDYMVLYGWDIDGRQIEEWTERSSVGIVRPDWAEITGFGPARAVASSHWVRETGITRDPLFVRGHRGLAQYNPDPKTTHFSQNTLEIYPGQSFTWIP